MTKLSEERKRSLESATEAHANHREGSEISVSPAQGVTGPMFLQASGGPWTDRFWSKVDMNPYHCWEWTGTLFSTGYGRFRTEHPSGVGAHRVAYELVKGPIPAGMVIDHLCRNRKCVNPEHLEPVTNAENIRRGEGGAIQRNKTHCPQGHEYTEENTWKYRDRRYCKKCRQDRQMERRGKKAQ